LQTINADQPIGATWFVISTNIAVTPAFFYAIAVCAS
jgi:hypothetical protein